MRAGLAKRPRSSRYCHGPHRGGTVPCRSPVKACAATCSRHPLRTSTRRAATAESSRSVRPQDRHHHYTPAATGPSRLGVEFEPTTDPCEDDSWVWVNRGWFRPAFSRTDADGKATVSMKLPRYMKPGMASMSVYAWSVVHESPCLRVEEDGFASYPEAFEVTKS